ncbi:MAG TPA: chemotaxis protein CheA [Burkholderiales bacterium]|nr:chemotaxis protein CheA [Burkholderiales bacterium]
MAIELRQFHQTFFDESLEGLADMEAALLKFEQQTHTDSAEDREALNAIFRVVHSIKGGSGTFGFGWITDFSHLSESLLDDLRDGRRTLDKRSISLLLRSVDCLRNLLDAERSGSKIEKSVIDEVTAELEELHRATPTNDAATAAAIEVPETAMQGWRIRFRPKPHLFRTGNDPLRILRELEGLGQIKIRTDSGALPSWKTIDPESCYLGWDIEVTGDVARAEIDEIFSWVSEDATLEIAPLGQEQSAPVGAPSGNKQSTMKSRGTSLRVSTEKVDMLMDVVGELVITQTMLQQVAAHFAPGDLPRLLAGLAQLERNVRELQEGVMHIRLLPLSFLFSRLPRLVRDIGEQLGKQVELQVSGEQTELDKTVIERISDPILHMVRNSMDHGLESPAERRAAGKPAVGTIHISAQQKGGAVMIEIEDDGRGLNYDKIAARAIEHGLFPSGSRLTPEQAHELIFLPGMTTSDTVTDISGRGVGLDVVRSNIRSLGGNVEVSSQPGKGIHFTIRLPLTLAILDGLSLQVGDQTYILPLVSITESVRLAASDVKHVPGTGDVFAMRKEYLPLARLYEIFRVESKVKDVANGTVVIIEADGFQAGLLVDEILGQQQVVIKSLETHYQRIEGIAAATILGDGTVALILDAGGLIRLAHGRSTTPVLSTAIQPSVPSDGASLH